MLEDLKASVGLRNDFEAQIIPRLPVSNQMSRDKMADYQNDASACFASSSVHVCPIVGWDGGELSMFEELNHSSHFKISCSLTYSLLVMSMSLSCPPSCLSRHNHTLNFCQPILPNRFVSILNVLYALFLCFYLYSSTTILIST